jgi:hypothetical protein
VCRLSETFGAQSVPILVEKCPALCSTLWLDFEQTNTRSLRNTLLRIAMREPIYRIVRFLASLFNRVYVPMWVFDYFLVCTRYRGFRKRIDEHEK